MNGHGENWAFSNQTLNTNAEGYLVLLKRGLQSLLTRQEEDTDPRSKRMRANMIKNQRMAIIRVERNMVTES